MKDVYCESYSTKEVYDTFGVGRETLRHYEKLGILNPYINPDNGYREYGYWDIATLVDVLKYRAVGLNLQEVKTAMFDLEFPQIARSIDRLHDQYLEEMLRYKMLERKSRIDTLYLKYALEHLEEITEVTIGDLFFIPYGRGERNIYHEDMKKALQNSQFFESAWILSEENDEKDPLCGLGFSSGKQYADYLGIQNGKLIPASKVVCKFTDVVGKAYINSRTFETFNQEALKLYPDASKETYAILLSRFYDKEKQYHQYFFVFKKLDDTVSQG